MASSKSTTPRAVEKAPTNGALPTIDVLTLEEAAAFLRVTPQDVLQMIETQDLPGRKFGDEWRFSKSAIQHWLGNPPRKGILRHAGRTKGDPYAEEMLRDIYARRGRPETEEG